MHKNMDTILEIKKLTVTIGDKRVINDVSLSLNAGCITALVGESGSGKTLTALSVLDLLPGSAGRETGQVWFKGRNVFELGAEDLRKVRGNDIAMVFQEPFTALNPVMRVGTQIAETIAAHKGYSGSRTAEHMKDLMDMVRLSPETALRYPHELSGGMRQRVMLAMAISCDPDVLILDEPTTALDVSIQKHILDLIKRIQTERRFSILFISHDFSIVNMIADDVCVMKEGRLVESGSKDEVLQSPRHPYTRQLIDCIPRLGDKRRRLPG